MPSKSFGGHSFEKAPYRGPREERDDRPERSYPPAGSNNRDLEQQLRTINSKLDAILRAMDV